MSKETEFINQVNFLTPAFKEERACIPEFTASIKQ